MFKAVLWRPDVGPCGDVLTNKKKMGEPKA
jgi:hypothetical protein